MLVIDTSVAVKWVVPANGDSIEADVGAALALIGQGLVTPDLMLAEFANAMWKKVRKKEVPAGQAIEALETVPTLISFLPTHALAGRALDISIELDHPVYDCVFIAAAQVGRCKLVTSDLRLITACIGTTYHALIERLGGAAP